MSFAMRTGDAVHLGLMLAAVALTYVVPFELLVLSYVVFGPAHDLTEISWLHDRKFFLPHRGIGLALIAIAIAAALIENAAWFGFVVWMALMICAMIVAANTAAEGTLLFMGALGLTAVMAMSGSSLAVLGILLPTLIHVSLFTLVFMALGAIRAKSAAQAALIAVYLAAIVLILALPPTGSAYLPAFTRAAQEYFGNVGPALSRLFGVPNVTLDVRLTSLLAFAYTYHYLNWFIKADVIRWADVPKWRLAAIAATSAAATGLYFYDYALGFTFLLALSLVHVLLEFPLNSLALRQLGEAAAQSLRRPAPVPVKRRRAR